MKRHEHPERPEADLDNPGELHTQADNDRPLTRAEAEVGGVVPGMIVYGDDSIEPNADDHRANEHAEPDEHV
jgi:hypothetical protein